MGTARRRRQFRRGNTHGVPSAPAPACCRGLLTYRGEGVREALRGFRDVVARSPRDLSCQVGLSVDGTLTPTLEVAPCYTGLDTDPVYLQTLRSAPGLVNDGLRLHTFLDQQRVFDSPYGQNRVYWKGHFVRELPEIGRASCR